MSGRIKSTLLIAFVAALTIFPLIIVKQPAAGPDGKQLETFKGSDDQASAAVLTLRPGYKPWYQTIYESPGPEVDKLLFALQGAIGAGFIGYYAGYSRGRARRRSTPSAY